MESASAVPLPRQGVNKVGAGDLAGLPRRVYSGPGDLAAEPSLYEFQRDGVRYDFLLSPSKTSARRLFVLFSGDAPRDRYSPPVFQRWSWAPRFPGHCLYVSDPILHVDPDVGLGWYVGNEQFDPLAVLAELVSDVAGKLGVPLGSVFSYGSSGGGFAALRLATALPETGVVAINPQTDIIRYDAPRQVGLFRTRCLGGRSRRQALHDFPRRLSLVENADILRQVRILYVQNLDDSHHYHEHLLPLMDALGLEERRDFRGGLVEVIFFAHEGGHTTGEPPDVFDRAMARVKSLSPAGDGGG